MIRGRGTPMTVGKWFVPAATGALVLSCVAARPDYTASIETWRRERLQRLTSDEGWLTVAGLFWLEEGDNRAGTENGAPVLLPSGSAQARVGVFSRAGGKVTFIADSSAVVTS